MFKAIKDTNTGVVYDWIKEVGDGTTISVNIPSSNWKKEHEWTKKEIENLFSPPSKPIKVQKKSVNPLKVADSEKEVMIATEVDNSLEIVLDI
jgi:hypothetical protein